MALLEQKPRLSIFFVLLVSAIISRFYGIWEWDLVNDEHFSTVTVAAERYFSFVNPAYYSLVLLTHEIFGTGEWLPRLPAFLLAAISVPVLYFTWSRALGRNVALIASVILIFSAWHLWYSQYARFYSGVFLFSSVAYYFFLKAIYVDRISILIWALVFSALAISFHLTAVFVPVSASVAYFLIWIARKNLGDISIRTIKIYIIFSIVCGLALLPFLINVLDNWVASGQTWGYGSILILPQLIKYIQIPIVVMAFFGWLIVLNADKASAIFFLVLLIVPALFFVIASPWMAISPSYAFYILPLSIILSGIACEELRIQLSSHQSQVVSLLALVLIISTLMPSFVSHFLDRRSLNFNSAVKFVGENYRSGDRVLTFIIGFKLPDDKENILLPYISEARDSYTDWRKELQGLLDVDNRTWIIISSKRKPLAYGLERWLLCNSKLVWRKHAVRLDYEVNGYEIYLVPRDNQRSNELNSCI